MIGGKVYQYSAESKLKKMEIRTGNERCEVHEEQTCDPLSRQVAPLKAKSFDMEVHLRANVTMRHILHLL